MPQSEKAVAVIIDLSWGWVSQSTGFVMLDQRVEFGSIFSGQRLKLALDHLRIERDKLSSHE